MSILCRNIFQRRTLSDGDLRVQRRSVNLRTSMTDHERETLTTLCARISYEKNPAVFLELLIELEALLNKAGWPKSDA